MHFLQESFLIPQILKTSKVGGGGGEFHIIMSIPKHNMSIILKWFKVNSLKANPGKTMTLGNYQRNSVTFNEHISNIWRIENFKLLA